MSKAISVVCLVCRFYRMTLR